MFKEKVKSSIVAIYHCVKSCIKITGVSFWFVLVVLAVKSFFNCELWFSLVLSLLVLMFSVGFADRSRLAQNYFDGSLLLILGLTIFISFSAPDEFWLCLIYFVWLIFSLVHVKIKEKFQGKRVLFYFAFISFLIPLFFCRILISSYLENNADFEKKVLFFSDEITQEIPKCLEQGKNVLSNSDGRLKYNPFVGRAEYFRYAYSYDLKSEKIEKAWPPSFEKRGFPGANNWKSISDNEYLCYVPEGVSKTTAVKKDIEIAQKNRCGELFVVGFAFNELKKIYEINPDDSVEENININKRITTDQVFAFDHSISIFIGGKDYKKYKDRLMENQAAYNSGIIIPCSKYKVTFLNSKYCLLRVDSVECDGIKFYLVSKMSNGLFLALCFLLIILLPLMGYIFIVKYMRNFGRDFRDVLNIKELKSKEDSSNDEKLKH